MISIIRCRALVALTVLAAAAASGGTNLPQKAFQIEGGIASVRAGVMPNTDAQGALPIGKLKYPTRYFVEISNESPYPIWLDAVWDFPDAKKDKPTKSKAIKSKKVPTQGTYWFYWDKLGVIVDQPIVVEIRVYADEKRTTPVGSQVAELLFDQRNVDVFLANFPSPFKNQTEQQRQAALISGWYDIPKPRTDIPGSAADAVLQGDIQLSIWKVDSMQRWTCEREVMAADLVPVDESRILSGMPADDLQTASTEQSEGKLGVERWTVRSCGEDRVYEVLLSASPSGGTDIMVVEMTAEMPD